MPKQPKWWTEEREGRLRELASSGLTAALCAKALGTTEAAVYGRARKLEISFDGSECASVTRFLAEGGRLLREEIGGVIGVRWCRAHRSGPGFPAAICETLLQQDYMRPIPGSSNVFAAVAA
jgi:hypothetical protein